MKIINLLKLLFLVTIVSCGDGGIVDKKVRSSVESYELTKMSEEIKDDANDGKVLNNYNSNEKAIILALVEDTANLVLALNLYSSKSFLIYKILENCSQFQQMFLLVNDQSVLDSFFTKAFSIAASVALENGIDISHISWKQFSYDFTQGISPFGIFSDGAVDWSTDFQQGDTLALIKGTGFSSWLFSPEFNLTNVKEATFNFTQLIGLDKNNRETSVEFNRLKFLNENFIVKISSDFDGVDPTSAKWDRIKISTMPTSLNFNKVRSEDYNLDKYIGKKITIAFHYDADSSKVGRHYLNWNIYDFVFKANGIIAKVEKRAAPLLVEKFSGTLNDFKSLKLSFDASSWSYSKGGGSEFALVNSNGTKSTTWLISNKYKISNIENATLSIKQVAKNLNLKKAKIKISTDYAGGDPTQSNWIDVAHSYEGDFIEDSWTNFSSELVDLSVFFGKEIVVGFEFFQEIGDSSTWEIVSLNFTGEGKKLSKSNINYTYIEPVDPSLGKIVHDIKFSEFFPKLETQNFSGNGALFSVNTRGNPSVRISGFKDKNIGVSRLVLKGVDIGDLNKPSFVLKHSLNFAKDLSPQKLIRVYLRDPLTGVEKLLELDNYPLGNSFDVFSSGPYFIDTTGGLKFIDLIFEYESLENNFTTWDLFNLQVMDN